MSLKFLKIVYIKSYIIEVFVVVIFLINAIFQWKNYVFSWDDADYMRVSSCFTNLLLPPLSLDINYCESLIYKAPIFGHLGVLAAPIVAIRSFLSPVEIQAQIITSSLIILVLIKIFFLVLIMRKFRALPSKIVFGIISFALFKDSFGYFMTDNLASILVVYCASIFLSSYQELISLRRNQIFISLCTLSFVAVGIRTTAIPIVLWMLTFPFLSHKAWLSFKKYLLFNLCFFSSFVLLSAWLLTAKWRPVLPSALQMFNGNQSQYFNFWTQKYGINLWSVTFHKYFFVIFALLFYVAISLALNYRRSNLNKIFNKSLFLAASPSFLVLLLFAYSPSKDSRFLEWPIFTLCFITIWGLETLWQPHGKPANLKVQARSALAIILVVGVLFIPANSSQNWGLQDASSVYLKLDNSLSSVCPITDSPSINVSKLLLVNELHSNDKDLTKRIVNLPDNVMNGKNITQSLKEFTNCKYVYFDRRVSSGTQKNEYLNIYKSKLDGKGYSNIFTDENIEVYVRN